MVIETKYDVEQEIFYMDRNKICRSVIRAIVYGIPLPIHAKSTKYSIIRYQIDGFRDGYYHFESDLFPTREELIKSL